MDTENENKEVQAVHERDLENLLNKLSLKDSFNAGVIKCKFCKNIITKENLYSLLSESGAVNFICDKPQCISNFMVHIENKKSGSTN